MKILLAEDEALSRETLRAVMAAAGHEVIPVATGREAWERWFTMRHRVIVADWLMPEMDGLELCRRIRSQAPGPYTYFILETIRSGRGNFLEAMKAGVDDFIAKPIDPEELIARLNAAERILGLRAELFALEGLLPMCSYCRRLRDDAGTWTPLEQYVESRSTAQFTHGVCPECYDKHLRPVLG
jgi:sigma-B regulation protein RsbU (phosphoserine phosphatase)